GRTCASSCCRSRSPGSGIGACAKPSSRASMSEHTAPFWHSLARAIAPYAQRADARESAADRRLLALGARLKRPFAAGLRRAEALAARVERAQPEIDALSESALGEAAQGLRVRLRRAGYVPEGVAQAFALVRAAAERSTGLRHFPVQ